MISAVRKSSVNYREQLMAAKMTVALHSHPNNNDNMEINQMEKHEQLEEEKKLLDKQKNLDNQRKEAEVLIQEGSNRLNGALTSGLLTEVQAANLLIVGGREKLSSVNEQQRLVTSDLDKLRLKRKDAFNRQRLTKKSLS